MTQDVGLRVREKARVRRQLIDTALRLFERQGYDHTTVQQIADAAHVSRRTFHRHFPSKAAVIFSHEEDLIAYLLAALDRRPPGESALTALRAALRDFVLDETDPETRRTQADTARRARHLLVTNPELRQENFTGAVTRQHVLAQRFAHRAGLPIDDLRPQLAAAACFAALGVGLDQWILSADRSLKALYETLDSTVASLQHGIDF
ncbi:TetR/AcrR family transcriptional regulator [Nocardia huaxiensis]|uniref:TetR family transcriptional regulator n=1 Tax=Nocardia huaxiensis TaxID=2755382 RepID=A0A7D6VAQ1_9NOCA|nr:TetR/AcrR family transcriptional regulator [Nocardia huaxiensis]QLY27675.1 TetR family transcriptional regulator [Nocardia huaxiensis]UFS98935.1 TetR/AcrR family transcriptional regulator [Nocardia huaxiensis]